MKRIVKHQYKTTEGDIVSILDIDGRKVTEIENNVNRKESEDDDKPRIIVTQKFDKQSRVSRIKELLLLKESSRESVKKTMYSEDMYKNNPNPASAFAGDWNFIHN